MSKASNSSSGGIGLGGMLFCIFLVLKLCGIGPVAAWSWWWITAPLWGPAVLAVLVILIFVLADEFLIKPARKKKNI